MKKKLWRKEGEEAREAEEGTRNPVRKKLIGERRKGGERMIKRDESGRSPIWEEEEAGTNRKELKMRR
jgi:hypothetical protein